ncbi:MAG: lytic transglycosylase domain-containing protein [Pseudomonadota bacterium]|nr:lytic transglycosylase domain-containing protein [Pseudomonadota bacterium]
MRLLQYLPAAQALPAPVLRRPVTRVVAHGLALLGLCLATVGAQATASGNTSSQATGCAAGWEQLLPRSQRERESQARGCTLSERPAAGAVAAGQLHVYSRPLTDGALGPLATPGTDAPAVRTPVPRSAPAPRGVGSAGTGASRPVALAPLIDQAARAHDIDPLLLHAIARVESRHRTTAVSHAGAHGLMQVIVPTASRFGVDNARALHDPETNLHVSARYLKVLQRRFGNDLTLVLAAYNAGEGAVERYGRRIPPFRETQGYVRKVLAEYELLRRVAQGPALLAELESGL